MEKIVAGVKRVWNWITKVFATTTDSSGVIATLLRNISKTSRVKPLKYIQISRNDL
jgi:hypothetical protein